jgi:hypothetical protein
MTTPPIIGLWSPAPGCGKSTVAQYLGDRQPGYMRVGFADPLRRMVVELLNSAGYPWHQAHRFVHWEKETPLDLLPGRQTARQLLRTLGTEWGRQQVADDVWIRCWEARIKGHDRVVTDDVRFLNEAQAVKAAGGQVWMIRRPTAEHNGEHVSEGALDDWDEFDVVIDNDSSIEEFRRKIDAALWP